jgi:hypothetical protein
MFIRDPGSLFFSIPDPRVQKAPEPGSATLITRQKQDIYSTGTNLVSDAVADISPVDRGKSLVVEQILPEEILQLLVTGVRRRHVLRLRRKFPRIFPIVILCEPTKTC